MPSYIELGFYWLSFLGGLHCLGLAVYLRWIYRSDNGNHRLLAGVIGLLSLWFFSGMLTADSASQPMPLIYPLFFPGFFLLMPLLYHYCCRSLRNEDISSLHYLTAPLIAVWVGLDQWIEPTPMRDNSSDVLSLADYTPIAAALTVLMFLQTSAYYLLIFRLLKQHWSRSVRSHAESLKDIRFRWLLILCLALMFNWMVRVKLMLIPVYFGDGVSDVMLMVPRMILLLSLYLLAFYGLHKITRAAYLRGQLVLSPAMSQKSSTQLLSSDELYFLQELMREPSHVSDKDNIRQ